MKQRHDAANCLDERYLADGSEVPRPVDALLESPPEEQPRHQWLALAAAGVGESPQTASYE